MLRMIKERQYIQQQKTDQLRESMRNKQAFCNFCDSTPQFPPTFKVQRNIIIPTYDLKRTPSYCDRILWRSQIGFEDTIKLLSFHAVDQVTTSDHKPIMGLFEITIPLCFPAIDHSIGKFALYLKKIEIINNTIDRNNTLPLSLRFISPYISTESIDYATLSPRIDPLIWDEQDISPIYFTINSRRRLKCELLPFIVFEPTQSTNICFGVITFCQLIEKKYEENIKLQGSDRSKFKLTGSLRNYNVANYYRNLDEYTCDWDSSMRLLILSIPLYNTQGLSYGKAIISLDIDWEPLNETDSFPLYHELYSNSLYT